MLNEFVLRSPALGGLLIAESIFKNDCPSRSNVIRRRLLLMRGGRGFCRGEWSGPHSNNGRSSLRFRQQGRRFLGSCARFSAN